MNKFEIFNRLMDETDKKLDELRALGVDTNPRLASQWRAMEKTMKVIDHKVNALKEHGRKSQAGAVRLDRPMIERSLDRAIKAAELLNLQLDDLIENAKQE